MRNEIDKLDGPCPACTVDATVLYPRQIDGECARCGSVLCAAHLIEHFREVHGMVLFREVHCVAAGIGERPKSGQSHRLPGRVAVGPRSKDDANAG